MSGAYYDPIRRNLLMDRHVLDPRNDDSVDEDLSMLAFFDNLTAVIFLFIFEIISSVLCTLMFVILLFCEWFFHFFPL